MIQIRKGVFETNSSSSHSIVITKENKPINGMVEHKYLDDDGKMYFWESELTFGRTPFNILNGWYDRLRYAIAAKHDSRLDEIEELCYKHVAGFAGFRFEKSKWGDGLEYGYVDHQSYGLLDKLLEKTTLEDFIFNDKYIVIIDGDEYCVFETLRETSLYNDENVEKIIPYNEWSYNEDDDV